MIGSGPKKVRVGVLVPGLHGGVDEATRYISDSNAFQHTELSVYQTKGLNARKAPFRFLFVLVRIVTDHLAGNLDIAHVNVSVRGSTLRKVIITSLLRLLNIPYVVQVHSGRYQQFWYATPAFGKALIRRMFKHANRTLILGHTFQQLVTNEIGVDPEKVVVVPNGIPIPPARHEQQPIRPTILFLGRLDENKAYRELIRALTQCCDLDWSAVLIGDGETDNARKIVEQRGLSERVTVKGWTDRVLADKAIQNCSILVSASHSEGLSLTLLEAMAHKLACVATPVGAHSDLLINELNCLTVEPGDIEQLSKALRRLIPNPDLRQELGSAARNDVIQGFSIDSVCDRLEQIYHDTLNESTCH